LKDNEQEQEQSSYFRAALEQALGPEILAMLEDVEFEDYPDLGAVMTFDFEGQSFWFERNGKFMDLSRFDQESHICILHLDSVQFRQDFLDTLAKSKQVK